MKRCTQAEEDDRARQHITGSWSCQMHSCIKWVMQSQIC